MLRFGFSRKNLELLFVQLDYLAEDVKDPNGVMFGARDYIQLLSDSLCEYGRYLTNIGYILAGKCDTMKSISRILCVPFLRC